MSKSTKRRAPKADMRHAAELARRYFERDPYKIKMDDGRIIERFVNGNELALSLEVFAERGTFEPPKELPLGERRKIIRQNFERSCQALKRRGIKDPATQAIENIAEVWQISERTVRGYIYGKKK